MTTIAVVDDDIDVLNSLIHLFELKGLSVVGKGYNGKDAIEICKKHNPDFLLLDLSMPKFDGFYTIEKLNEAKNPVKIIVMTGLIGESTIEKLDKISLFSVVMKPIDFKALWKILQV